MESAQICLELRYLVYTSILVLVLWMPYILVQLFGVGPGKALSYPEDGVAAPKWTSRWKRAHYNLVENIVPFAVAVTAGELLNIHNGVTAACAMIFFWARVVHPFAQALNIWGLRTVIFAIGSISTLVYLITILMAAT